MTSAAHGKVNVVAQRFHRPASNLRVVGATPGKTRHTVVTPGVDDRSWTVRTRPAVRYRSIWHGVDMRVTGGRQFIKTAFVLSPDTQPSVVRLDYNAAVRRLSIGGDGSLVAHTARGNLIERPPWVYQFVDGHRVDVSASYRLIGRRSYGFTVNSFDRTLPLYVDPEIEWSRYAGGAGEPPDFGGYADAIHDVAADESGVYVVGATRSPDFPGFDQDSEFTSTQVAFVAKLDAQGNVLFSTSLGLSTTATAYAVALGPTGDIYLTGTTIGEFPVTEDAAQTEPGIETAFVVRLDPSGRLRYSTLLGGRDDQSGYGIAVDSSGNAIVVGETTSLNFPVVAPLQPELAGIPVESAYQGDEVDAFITIVSADGSEFLTSTYLGGAGDDRATDVALAPDGTVTLTGTTASDDFPVLDAAQPQSGGGSDAFVARLSPDARQLMSATYLGGDGAETGRAIDIGRDGRIWLTGSTDSANFPVERPHQPLLADKDEFSQPADAYIAALQADGSSTDFATYLGGTSVDLGVGIAVNDEGNVVVAGSTLSGDFPTTSGHPNQNHLENDVFFAELDGSSYQPTSVTTFGGSAEDRPYGLAVAPEGVTYVAGVTTSPDLPSAGNGRRGADDGFVTRLSADATATGSSSGAHVWADIAGPARVRTGRPASLVVYFGNSGDKDAHAVPLWIEGIPADSRWELSQPALSPRADSEGEQEFLDELPRSVTTASIQTIPLLLHTIPAGTSGSLVLTLTTTQDSDFVLRVWTDPPYFGSPINPAFADCLAKVVLDWFVEDFIPDNVPIPVKCQNMIRDAALEWFERMPDSFFSDGESRPSLLSNAAFLGAILETVTTCVLQVAGEISPAWQIPKYAAQILEFLSDFGDRADKIASCIDAYTKGRGGPPQDNPWGTAAPGVEWPVESGSSVDPNDKSGSPGKLEERYLTGDTGLAYDIQFENLAAATAPAQVVQVIDTLNADHIDLTSLTFGPITFAYQHVQPPLNSHEFHTVVDLDSDPTLAVKIDAELDLATATLSWRFETVDRLTGIAPTDPLAGFLPPNTAPPEGQGSVAFHVNLKSDAATDTVITNHAEITFDDNAPIQTPPWHNTVDVDAPYARVVSAEQTGTGTATVSWRGSDAGSGVAQYVIYVSTNDGPFREWLRTSDTEATLATEKTTTYTFYAVGQDHVGNLELRPQAGESVTFTRTESNDLKPVVVAVSLIVAALFGALILRRRMKRRQ